ncbi:9084_t:CDS:2, partial [Dentiscutata erythropus]
QNKRFSSRYFNQTLLPFQKKYLSKMTTIDTYREGELMEGLKFEEGSIESQLKTINELNEQRENDQKTNQDLIELIENLTKELSEKQNECKNLLDRNQRLDDEKKDISTYKQYIQRFQANKEVLEKNIKELEEQNVFLVQQISKHDQSISQLQKERDDNYIKLVSSNNHNEQKDRKIKELRDEASKLQAALGNATTFRLNDDDKNSTTQLNTDIENLQDLVENYVSNLKGGVNIDFNKVNQLLNIYGSQTQIDPQTPNKPLIKAVLQRHVLTKILKFADSYFKIDFNQVDENLSYLLESNIAYKTNDLIKSIERLSYERVGSDLVTQAAPIKLRQQIFAVLGYRGFSDTFENGLHPFISEWQEQLNQSINRYRSFKDPKKSASLDEKAIGLISEVIRIFFFRFKVQEPTIKYHWFQYGDKITKKYMKVLCDDDEIEEAFVDICSFPLIGRDFNDDSKRKIFTHAKVFSRIEPKKKSLINSVTTKVTTFTKGIQNVITRGDQKDKNDEKIFERRENPHFQSTSTQKSYYNYTESNNATDSKMNVDSSNQTSYYGYYTESNNATDSKMNVDSSNQTSYNGYYTESNNATDSKMNVDSSNTGINEGFSKTEGTYTESSNDPPKTGKTDNSSNTNETVDSSSITHETNNSFKTKDSSEAGIINNPFEFQETNDSSNKTQETNDSSNKTQETIDSSNKTQEANNSSNKAQDSSNKTQETNGTSNKTQEIIYSSNKTQETNDPSNKIQETNDSSNKTQEANDSSNKAQETNDSSNKTQETNDSSNKTQETNDFSNKTQETDDSSNKAQETNNSSNKTQVTNDSFNKTQGANDSSNKTQETNDSSNKTQETNDSSNKTQETKDSSNETRETNDSSNETQETNDSSNKTQETNDKTQETNDSSNKTQETNDSSNKIQGTDYSFKTEDSSKANNITNSFKADNDDDSSKTGKIGNSSEADDSSTNSKNDDFVIVDQVET